MRKLFLAVVLTVASAVPVTPSEGAPVVTGVLRRIGGCESSGRPNGPLLWRVVNRQGSSASGAFQIVNGTWDRYKGYRRAMDAPPEVQIEKAQALQRSQMGLRHWNASRHCWS